jgi:hypothetical protein
MSIEPRPMMDDEIAAVAALWHDTWHDSHDHIAHPALCAFRTADYFLRRIEKERETVRVAGAPGRAIGLCIVLRANLDMLFVAASESAVRVSESAFWRMPRHECARVVSRRHTSTSRSGTKEQSASIGGTVGRVRAR